MASASGVNHLRTWRAHEDACILFSAEEHGVSLQLEQRPQRGATSSHAADGTNLKVWPATLTFGRWLCAHREAVQNKSVVELGAGSGAAGIICAALGASKVWITDVPDALPLIVDNIARNEIHAVCSALPCTWGNMDHIRALREAAGAAAFDVVIASELLYKQAPETFDALLWTMRQLSHAGTTIYVVYEFRGELFDDMHFFTGALETFDVQTVSLSQPEESSSTERAQDPADEWLYIYTPHRHTDGHDEATVGEPETA